MADIDTFFPTEFSSNWEHILQQEQSILGSVVNDATFTGDRKKFNQAGDEEMTDVTTRKGDTPDGDFDATAYWLSHRPKELVTTFDEWDATFLGNVVLPTSDTVKLHAQAYNRALDATIRDALGGTRYIGTDGTTTDALPSGQKVAKDFAEVGTGANSGLTIEKLRQAMYLMDEAQVPSEGRYMVIKAKQKQDLLRTTEATNKLYTEVQALYNGQINHFMGFTFLVYKGLSTLEANVRQCFAFHRDAIKKSVHGRQVHMDKLPTRRHALQIRTVAMMGAVRTQNELVVQVACHEAP
jgi:hypothetical protein